MTRSFYEITTPLSTVKKQHFVEWFSGKGLNTDVWDTSDSNGSPTFTMGLGGCTFATTGTATNSNFIASWNDKDPFDVTGSVAIFRIKPEIQSGTSGNVWFSQIGLGYRVGNTGHVFAINNSQTYISLQTSQSETHTRTNTTMLKEDGARWFNIKIENMASSCNMSFDGRLQVTATSGLQTTDRMQPTVYHNRGYNNPAGVPTKCTFNYFEAYNT